MPRSKKAQSEGGAVAVILIIIALFMVLYLLFISPEERERILDSNNTGSSIGTSGRSSFSRIELVAESPGLVTPTKEFAIVHRLPGVNIFLKEEPSFKPLSSDLTVSRTLLSENSPTLKFNLDHLEETTTASLIFSVEESEGTLELEINDNIFYSKQIQKKGVEIVEIPKSSLIDRNEIKFRVSSPGIAFWATNKYHLKDISVKQEYVKRNREETRTFTITPQEKLNMLNTKLKYSQTCNDPLQDQLTTLDILINDKRSHTAEVRCANTEEEIEIDPDSLIAGSNTITFRLEKGDFTFNQLKIETESRESERPTYFFSLTDRQFDDIQRGRRGLKLQILMDNNQRVKNARILINSNNVLMQVERNDFVLDLKDYVLEGTNFIKLIPVNSFNIIGFKVILE
ncbi:MAG TPA: hypothetical protein VJI68_00195 [Candidatus Nanoarchaeia archaeon]|nr:hypothetical protein [Candidatus Nanoarchaeia archaeon]